MVLVLRGIIGLEREVHDRPTGLSTFMMVYLGSTIRALSGHLLDDSGLVKDFRGLKIGFSFWLEFCHFNAGGQAQEF